MGWAVLAPLTPKRWRRALGVDASQNVTLLRSARDLAIGVGIVRNRRSFPWMLARVGSDLYELRKLRRTRGRLAPRERLRFGLQAFLTGAAILDGAAALWLSGKAVKDARGLRVPKRVVARITIHATPYEIYEVFRNFENLPRFMNHVLRVEELDERRSRWTVRGPAQTSSAWEAEITEDVPGERIAWKSLEGADIDSSGIVRFVPAPGNRGTEVHVAFSYGAPAGKLGVSIAKLWGEEPSQQVRGDLRRLKQLVETGDVVHSDASIHQGRHPARPSNPKERRS